MCVKGGSLTYSCSKIPPHIYLSLGLEACPYCVVVVVVVFNKRKQSNTKKQHKIYYIKANLYDSSKNLPSRGKFPQPGCQNS